MASIPTAEQLTPSNHHHELRLHRTHRITLDRELSPGAQETLLETYGLLNRMRQFVPGVDHIQLLTRSTGLRLIDAPAYASREDVRAACDEIFDMFAHASEYFGQPVSAAVESAVFQTVRKRSRVATLGLRIAMPEQLRREWQLAQDYLWSHMLTNDERSDPVHNTIGLAYVHFDERPPEAAVDDFLDRMITAAPPTVEFQPIIGTNE